MSNINNRLFLQSLLADAAYVDLSPLDTTNASLGDLLAATTRYKGIGTSDPNRNSELANVIDANFNYVKGSQKETGSGFSATLFERRAPHYSKYYKHKGSSLQFNK